MKITLILLLSVSPCVFAQDGSAIHYQTAGPIGAIAWDGMMLGNPHGSPVKGAPNSATIILKALRTLADGSQVVQTSTGAIAGDSQGRTRQELPLLLNSPNFPHIAIIEDPSAHTSDALNLADKTAQKMSDAEGIPGVDERNSAFSVMHIGGVASVSNQKLSSGLWFRVRQTRVARRAPRISDRRPRKANRDWSTDDANNSVRTNRKRGTNHDCD